LTFRTPPPPSYLLLTPESLSCPAGGCIADPLPGAPRAVQAKSSEPKTLILSGIGIEKTPSATLVRVGDVVTYTYVVSNHVTGPLSSVSVSDDKCAPVNYQGGDDGDSLLESGELWTYTCAVALTQTTINVATASATDQFGDPVSAQDTARVKAINTDISIVKSVDKPPAMKNMFSSRKFHL
jgi:hypothetical protein